MSAHGAVRVYNGLPRFAQTLALNLFGVRNRLRMSAWSRYLSKISDTERMPRQRQMALVESRLRDILAHAVSTVPRYADLGHLMSRIEDPSVDAFSTLLEFPIVTRDEIKKNPEHFMSARPRGRRLVTTVTSGTTGTPFTTWMEAGTFMKTDALWWRRNVWSGYRSGDWVARIVGDPIVPLADADPRDPWRVSWIDRRIYLSSFHLRRDAAQSYFRVLERLRPAFIQGYPSSLEILAGFALEGGRTLNWRPRAVWYSSEPMFEHQRDVVSRAFGAPVVGLYGSAERVVSAAQCEKGQYHLSIVDGFVEGQFGRLEARRPAAVTTIMNSAMPLIRFELGDDITPAPEASCGCGRTLPVIEPVITKKEDWIETPTGRRVSSSALTWAFKDVRGVRRSQIIQTGAETVEVHVDADEGAFAEASGVLQQRLGEMFFGEIEISFIRDENIQIMDSGKTRFVVRRR